MLVNVLNRFIEAAYVLPEFKELEKPAGDLSFSPRKDRPRLIKPERRKAR